ncbi:hypothetical protein GCM10010329_82050 [Streptomyces spiroverticillatus]|uniref:Uncharacterized protein n=1 Tax=Streptomyces finlayi TaxID=67296 RepID=A0A919CFQ0_9ACTN|nr:hypothetical protein [Streptomyces finlayi]GHA47049.1 hypothetical protein GCM10010329_82050 [Streptomyces spiroverticillatus]GHD18335.1 hypothetical protein GCM10010334_81130 [Streptomyces finlayi]
MRPGAASKAAWGGSPPWLSRKLAQGSPVRERRDQIVERHRQGLKGYEIARELPVSAGLVSTRLKEARSAGVDLTRCSPADGKEMSRNADTK